MTAAAVDQVARVLIDSPLPQLDRLFDYRVPPELAAVAVPGVRVRVPLRSAGRIADGYLVELTVAGDYAGALSELDDVVSPVPVLAPEVWTLARAVADRAAGAASDVVRLAVPKRQVRVEKAWLAAGHAAAEPASATDVVERHGPDGDLTTCDLTARNLADYDLARIDAAIAGGGRLAMDAIPRVVRLPSGTWTGQWAISMAALAGRALATGRTAILAVPDYRDQEQLAAALEAVLPADRIVRLDAKQSNPERYHALLSCLGGRPLAVIGNRSVIYAPAARLGLIVVWDDGDPLHSEPLSPYVHTRDAALVRARQQEAALVFLGHCRSTDVERLVEIGWLDAVAPSRAYLPRVIPTAQQPSQDRLAAQARIPSSAWREARAALEDGPVLVQVARPGYAPRLACASCGESARCGHCDGPLAMKTARGAPACRWCGRIAAAWVCTNCAGTALRLVGQGAGRTAEELGRAFPGVRVIVADGDRPVLHVGEEPALVIATRGAEPIAAGGYRAVLLLDGERMLARESLRVGEDCLRWWANAIALAARGAPSVLVGVGGALAGALVTWRLAGYAAAELEDRRRLRFPPAVRVATVVGDTESVQRAIAAAEAAGGAGGPAGPGAAASSGAPAGIDVLGPVEVEGAVDRAIVRFEYARGAAVASALRAEVIRNATSRRRRVTADGPRPSLPTLKVRFDDTEPFDQ